jgi:hypothetical protein
VGEADLQIPLLAHGLDQPGALQALDHLGWGDVADEADVDRLPEGDQLEGLTRGRRHPPQSLLDQPEQAGRVGDGAVEPPDAVLGGERTRLEGTEQQLAQEQQVPLAGVSEGPQRGAVDRSVEAHLDQRRQVGAGQLADVHPSHPVVLPQRQVGRLVGVFPDGQHEEGADGPGELIDHRARRAVELLRIVDDQGEPASLPAAPDRLGDRVDRPLGAPRIDAQLQEERSERGEGESRGRRRGPDGHGGHASIGGELGGGPGEPGLPHACGADQADARAAGVAEGRAQQFELEVPPDQRPGAEHRKGLPSGHGPPL